MSDPYAPGNIGIRVHQKIANTWIYRFRYGKQEKVAYYVPTNPQTEVQQANRATFADAIIAAAGATEEQKQAYRVKTYRMKGQTWRTLFIRDYLNTH